MTRQGFEESGQYQAGKEIANWGLIRRLLALSWRYRIGCVKVLGLQVVMLTIGLGGLGLSGLGIDFIRSQVDPGAGVLRWPFGLHPPADWHAINVLFLIAALILLLALLRSGLSYLYTVALARLVQQSIVVDLRAQVYDKLQRLSFRFFDARASGTLINRVTGDVQSARMFVDSVIIETIVLLISLSTFLVYMVSIHPLLTLACLSPVPLLWLLTTQFSRRVKPAYRRSSELVDDLVLDLAETIQGIHVIKGFALEAEQRRKFRASNRAVLDQKRGIFRKVSVFRPSMDFVSQFSLVILLGYGGYLVMTDRIPLGTGLVVFVGLLQRFAGQVNAVAEITNSIQHSLNGARRVFEILEAPVEIRSASCAQRLSRARGEVQFEQVDFGYGQAEPVLQGIDLHVVAGQCVAMVGPTGAGKSALLSLIPRFYDPTRGRVLLDGIPVADLDLDDLRRNIGLVFQESFLFSNTVAANIAFGRPDATRDQIERAARIAMAHDFIQGLSRGYDTVLGEGGADLSGGQRQRIAIARAVLLDPPLLLLDDPTAAVDAHTEHEILQAMEVAMRHRTTFLVTHRFSALRRADWIVVLDGGRIVQQGRHGELIRVKGPYRRAARIQFDEESEQLLGLADEGAG